jgi:uncharacterized protein YjiK
MDVKRIIILLLLFLLRSIVFPQDNKSDILFEKPGYHFPYQLAEPIRSWKLPKSLVEISGLSYIDDQRLACVQDENGIIYIFNLKAGEIEREINFGDNGDYEGIEIIENDAWVLKSNGMLYNVTDYLKKTESKTKKITTALSGRNNAEGLAYDPINKNLFIACKGSPFQDDNKESGYKAIYSFNLETKKLNKKPVLLINLDTIKYYKKYDPMTRLGNEVMAYLDPSEGDKTFQPSGIAIHPITGDLFILGSVGRLLLVFSGKGDMLAIIKLQPKIFPKPEGICFNPDGTLYISNEGAGQKGTILKFAANF